MAKRSGYFQLKQPFASKKPKLDIEIIPSQQYNPQPSTSKTSSATNVAAKATGAENLWDDDDDDIIVLATQAFEADVTFGKFSRSVKSSTQQTTEVIATTMRQHVVGGGGGTGGGGRVVGGGSTSGSEHPKQVTDKLVAELFADGEDDLFSEKLDSNYNNIDNAINHYFNNNDDDFNMDEFRQEGQAPSIDGRRRDPPAPKPSPWQEEFKVPVLLPPAAPQPSQAPPLEKKMVEAITIHVKEEPSTSRLGIFRPKISTATKGTAAPAPKPVPSRVEPIESAAPSSQKKEQANEIQVKFLTKHVEQLAKKVDSLQKDYNEAVEKAQVKDGEVSMLRYELKVVKSTNEQLRMEKIRERETIQKEWIEKMKNLEKTITAQKVENEFKEMEIMNLKTKRLNATMRSVEPPTTVRPSEQAPTTSAQPAASEKEETSILTKMLPRLTLSQPMERRERLEFDPEAFVNPTDTSAQGRRFRKYSRVTRNEFAIADQLVSLQTCLSQMLTGLATEGGGSHSVVLAPRLLPVVGIATRKGLDELNLYCQRLGQQKETDYRLCGPRSKMELTAPVNVFIQEKLFVGEQAVVIRRFLALVGLYCRISDELAVDWLLGKGLVLRLAKDVKRISTAVILMSLHGVVTGVAALLNGLSFHPRRFYLYGANGSQLMELFRSIVLCQTDAPYLMVQLSDFLRRLSQITDGSVDALLNRLCTSHQPVETGQQQQHQQALRKQYRLKSVSFSLGTCTLQMYAALLENSVRQHARYEGWQLKPLLKNTENTIQFLRNVLVQPVGWIKSFYDKEDPNGCELCHIRMVSAFVMLLHRVLLCWNQQSVEDEKDILHIHCIAQNGVLLLYDLFQTSYRKKLLRLAGPTVRYRLRVTYNWLMLYEKEFNFLDIHRTTLSMLDMRLLMIDPLRAFLESEEQDDEKKATQGEDERKTESKSIVEDVFAGFFNTYSNNSATY
uniref:Uncharacterized protein n=1 Tax=Anopheles epiroticus TaxID=199890 RepID=A0A182PPQ2_9DIPT